MALPPLIPLPAGSSFDGRVLTVAGLDLSAYDYELVLVDAQGVEITPLVSTVGLGAKGTSTPGGPVGFGDLTGQPGDNAALEAVLEQLTEADDQLDNRVMDVEQALPALAPLRDPEFTGTPTAPNQPTAVAGNELVNAGWIRQLLASQLNLSPFSSGGGRILHVCGRGQTTAGEAGNPNRPYASLPAAHSVAQAGDIVLVWPGGSGQDAFGRVYYTEAYTQTKPLNVYFHPAAIYGADIYLGNPGGSAPASHYFSGGEFLARILQARQAGGMSKLLVENARFTGALGGVQYFANLSGGDGGPHIDQFITRGSTFDSKRSAGNSAPIRNNGTQVFGNCDMLIDSCLVMTTETPCAIYSARQGGSIQFLGTTECRPGPGQPVLQALAPNGGGNAVPEADWFIDKRPVAAGGGAAYTAGAGLKLVGTEFSQDLSQKVDIQIATSAAQQDGLLGYAPINFTQLVRSANATAAALGTTTDDVGNPIACLIAPQAGRAVLQFQLSVANGTAGRSIDFGIVCVKANGSRSIVLPGMLNPAESGSSLGAIDTRTGGRKMAVEAGDKFYMYCYPVNQCRLRGDTLPSFLNLIYD